MPISLPSRRSGGGEIEGVESSAPMPRKVVRGMYVGHLWPGWVRRHWPQTPDSARSTVHVGQSVPLTADGMRQVDSRSCAYREPP